MDDNLKSIQLAADLTADPVQRSEAFSVLVKQYWNMALGCALEILSDPASSEDAIQEVFISAWRNIGSLRKLRGIPGMGIVVWQCYYFRRSSSPQGRAN